MTGGFFALLDDITTLMDDVAVMTKTATHKTVGILGDDLAVNAEQLVGISPKRELPIVWSVTKGSLLNKLILVPVALLLSAFMPSLINYLLLAGGLYLCYEGAEKVIEWLFLGQKHHKESSAQKVSPELLEKRKVKSAIATDFILSIEIIVIVLGLLQKMHKPFAEIVISLSIVAIFLTFAVYGAVALIVKIDDLGIYLVERKNKVLVQLGKIILWFAPNFMKSLMIIGTIAMFVVGGHIWSANIPYIAHLIEPITAPLGATGSTLAEKGLETFIGLIVGWIAVLCIQPISKLITYVKSR